MEESTTQLTPEKKPSPPLRGTRDLFDINILPARFRRRSLSLIALLPWLLLVILLSTIYPTYLFSGNSQAAFKEKGLELNQVQTSLELYQFNNQERDELQTQIDTALAQKDAIIQSLGGLQLSSSRWSPTLFQIEANTPQGIMWSNLSQRGFTIRLEGTAGQYNQVINLLDSLLALDSLKYAEIDSIERMDAEEVPAPDPEVEADTNPNTTDQPGIFRFTILATTLGEVAP